ncbi:MAG: TIGR00153 family protein [Thermodesulfovibrio sp.]|nr:TIGR00153 family protein [Thermodesulfovibrio sp.]MDW7972246.1 TIGR00153 family protein [Thermodesulfovibrio sp.]
MFEKIIFGGKLEKKVIKDIKTHLRILCSALECFRNSISNEHKEEILCVFDLEREADSIRREIISTIHQGAFLPYIRPNICRFIEMVDEAFDTLEDAAFEFRYIKDELYKKIKDECEQIAKVNSAMCEILSIAFDTLIERGDLKEKNLAIRIYEKKVDDLKFEITEKLRNLEITNFWDGKILSDFVEYITKISDLIEDASDYLYIIEISLK